MRELLRFRAIGFMGTPQGARCAVSSIMPRGSDAAGSSSPAPQQRGQVRPYPCVPQPYPRVPYPYPLSYPFSIRIRSAGPTPPGPAALRYNKVRSGTPTPMCSPSIPTPFPYPHPIRNWGDRKWCVLQARLGTLRDAECSSHLCAAGRS